MKIRSLMLACGVSLFGLPTSALADAPEGSDVEKPDDVSPPIQTYFIGEVPQVQKPLEFQGTARARLYGTEQGPELQLPLQVDVGVAPRLELEATVPIETQQSLQGVSRGVSNVEVGVGYELMNSKERSLIVTTGVDALLPAPTSDLAEQSYGVRARVAAYRRLGAVAVTGSVAPMLVREQGGGTSPRAELGIGAMLGQGFVVPTAEVRSELGAERDLEASAGVQLRPTERFHLGLGLIGGFHDNDLVYGGASTLMWELGG